MYQKVSGGDSEMTLQYVRRVSTSFVQCAIVILLLRFFLVICLKNFVLLYLPTIYFYN